MARHWIVVNRAQCGRCGEELTSTPAEEHQLCRCGYLEIAGAGRRCVRTCLDLPGDDGCYRDFVDTSVFSETYIRRGGLIVEAFRAEGPYTVVGPDGRAGLAEPGDIVVFEPEGGHTAWTLENFCIRHELALVDPGGGRDAP